MPVSDEGYQHIEHGFEPVFDRHSRVLVLGSFPSVLSRANAFYYGNPQNRFWRVIAACLGAPVPPNEGDPLADGTPATLDASIAAKRFMLLDGGVALWDVIESCDIKGSSDASIRNVVPAHIEQLEIYAALFCLEYKVKPSEIEMELRLYQNNEILYHAPTAEDIVPIMDKIITFDKVIRKIREQEG